MIVPSVRDEIVPYFGTPSMRDLKFIEIMIVICDSSLGVVVRFEPNYKHLGVNGEDNKTWVNERKK